MSWNIHPHAYVDYIYTHTSPIDYKEVKYSLLYTYLEHFGAEEVDTAQRSEVTCIALRSHKKIRLRHDTETRLQYAA